MHLIMNSIALCTFNILVVGFGARVSQHQHREIANFDRWYKNASFVCMKKWRKQRILGGGNTDNYCLVDLEEMLVAYRNGMKSKTYTMMVSSDWSDCQDERKEYAMKLCNLKGKGDPRVSYNNRALMPKACFSFSGDRFKPDGKTIVNILQAAVTKRECDDIIRKKPAGRGKFSLANEEDITDTCPDFVFSGYCGTKQILNCYDPDGAPPAGEIPQCGVNEDYRCPNGMKKCHKATLMEQITEKGVPIDADSEETTAIDDEIENKNTIDGTSSDHNVGSALADIASADEINIDEAVGEEEEIAPVKASFKMDPSAMLSVLEIWKRREAATFAERTLHNR